MKLDKKTDFIILCIALALYILLLQTDTVDKTIEEDKFSSSCEGCNIILITLDTTRADYLGLYGQPLNTSPNIDMLGDKSVVFEQCIAPIPITVPSHATILTGLMPRKHGALENTFFLPDKVETIAEYLSARDYLAAAYVNVEFLRGHGFEQGMTSGDDPFFNDSAEVTENAIKYIDENKDEKFFLWVHYFDAHSPYEPGKEYSSMFTEKDMDYDTALDGALKNRSRTDLIKHLRRLYMGELRQVDDNVGEILNRLRDDDLMNRTIIVVAADHGEAIFEDGEFTHGSLVHDRTVRVPLIIYSPRLSGLRIKEQVSLADIAPTILSHIGVKEKNKFDGIDLGCFFEQEVNCLRNRTLFVEKRIYDSKIANGVWYWVPAEHEVYSLRQIPYKIITYITRNETEMTKLFDISKDPQEKTDIKRSQQTIFRDMNESLYRSIKEYVKDEKMLGVDEDRVETLKNLGYVS